ncbi:MAG: Asp-tRNA(Asn)/Glu-tRNA(Gln) amidotransferase subunit GatB, partial [Myxococcota bacterium]
MDVIAVIGLECHAQLRTATKLFCACAVASDAPPNTLVCPVCLGHPGAMPAPNAEAVRLAVRAALALGCEVAPTSTFARKHYFYPDLPKGYQITQADRPLATGGAVRGVRLVRVHLEEDAGKLVHDPAGTGVDWNRAGVPLVEIVSTPSVRSPGEAEVYLRTLHRVLVEAGVCLGDLEKGHFRCDANVSVHRPGEPWGARVEIKNVNSFRFVRQALAYEIERQAGLLAAGTPTGPETRAWAGDRTILLRGKERAEDYRYVPEPDLPVLAVGPELRAVATEGLAGVPLEAALDAA